MLSSESTVGEFMFTTVTNMAKRETQILPRLTEIQDASAVHDFRVEIRKLRSIFGSCSPLFETKWLKSFRSELKAIDNMISPLRDAHVLFDRFNNYPDTLTSNNYALFVTLESVLNEAHIAFQTDVHSQQFNAFLSDVELTNPKEIPTLKSNDSIHEYLAEFNREQWKSLKTKVRKAKPHQLHQVRIKAKKVRYLAEACVPVLGQKIERRAHIANKIQTLLGELQDSRMMIGVASTPDILEHEKREIDRIEITWEQLAHKVLS